MTSLQVFVTLIIVTHAVSSIQPWDHRYKEWGVLTPENVPEAENTLRYVFVVSRHGIYYPPAAALKDDLYPKFRQDKYEGLTERGAQLMQRVGRMLMGRYKTFITNLEKDVRHPMKPQRRQFIKITASDAEVCATCSSAKELVKGMFGELNEDYRLTVERSRDFDKTHMVNENKDDKDVECPRFIKERDMSLKTPECANWMSTVMLPDDLKLIHQTLRICKLQDIYDAYERVQMERLSGLNLPKWTKEDSGATVLREMRKLAIQRIKKKIGETEERWRYLINAPLTGILKEFGYYTFPEDQHFSEGTKSDPQIHIHVTEDYLLYALMWWLRLDRQAACAVFVKETTPSIKTCGELEPKEHRNYYAQVGDTLILEFHEIDGKDEMVAYFMRLRGEPKSLRGIWWLSLRPKLEQLKQPCGENAKFDPKLLIKGLIQPKDWKKCCNTDYNC